MGEDRQLRVNSAKYHSERVIRVFKGAFFPKTHAQVPELQNHSSRMGIESELLQSDNADQLPKITSHFQRRINHQPICFVQCRKRRFHEENRNLF